MTVTPTILKQGKNVTLFWTVLVLTDNDGVFRRGDVLQVTAGSENGETLVAQATLQAKIEIPEILIKDNRLKTRDEITQDLEDARDELIHRFSRVELEWTANANGFFGLTKPFNGAISAAMAGYARVHFAQLLGPETEDPKKPFFEMVLFAAAKADLSITSNATTTNVSGAAAIGAVVVLRRDDLPGFRIDLDDFNIGFPEFEMPKLDLPALTQPLAFRTGEVSRAFEQLLKATGITVEVTPGGGTTPALLIDTNVPSWAIVQATNTAMLQPFNVTVKSNGATLFKIENLTAAYNNSNKLTIVGTVVIDQTIHVGDGDKDLGPFHLAWRNVDVRAHFEKPLATGNAVISAEITFDSVTLSSRLEPDITLGVKGKVRLTPNGIDFADLTLMVGADPLKLAMLFERLASGILRVRSSPDDQQTATVLPKLLNTLARLGAAAARAVAFVGDKIANLLVGIARLIGKLLEDIAALLKDAADNLVFDIRLTVDPLEILQIVVTTRRAVARVNPVDAGGKALRVTLNKSWNPALLIDFVSQPGVYLLAVPDPTAGPDIGSISTDLWLKQGNDVAAVRDADKDTGDRADKPLIKLTLTQTTPGAIVLAGVRRGEPLFLHRIPDPPVTVKFNGVDVTVCGGRLVMVPLKSGDIQIKPEFEPKRALTLIGLGDTGQTSGGPGFLDKLKQVIWIEKFDKTAVFDERTLKLDVQLGIRVAGVEVHPTIHLDILLDDLSVTIEGGDHLEIKGPPINEHGLGLQWVITPANFDGQVGDLFIVHFSGLGSTLALHDGTKMEVRYTAVSADGCGLVFTVTKFEVGRGGLDLDATVTPAPVRLNGLDVPFQFTSGGLSFRGGRLVEASVAGKGKLPADLVGDAGASIALAFTQRDGEIELQSGSAKIDKAGEPIVCHSTRFTLTISNLGLDFVRENDQLHFFFVVTGSLQFTPKVGEFESGLLKFLKDVRINLDKVPLAGDGRVLAQHISFQVALKPKLRVTLFDAFSFELRGIGFHPNAPKFDGKPALNVSGQIAFAEIGDVVSAKIDFHGLWIAPPADGQSLPRIKADGLGVEIGLPGTARLSGTVLAVDERIPTLEGRELAPPEYKTYGFLGEGRLAIEGFATMAASFGFLEVQLPNSTDRRRSFFLFIEEEQIAIEIPTPIWTLYMREVGFGFGYRYTLEGIKEAEKATSVAQLIRTLDDVSTRQGELASFAAWRPDPEKENVTLALRAAIQFAPAAKKYDEKQEEKTANPFLFDLIAALRSDMTFLMSVRGWPFANYFDFVKNTEDMRTNPFFIGYMYISAPRSEFLARFTSRRSGFIGRTPPIYTQLEVALRAVEFSATLYIRPGLLHYELGWPDQLKVTLFNEPNLHAEVRGGMIFRVWDRAFLTGYNIEADAFLRIGGSAGGGSLGVSAEASLSAAFLARFIAYLDFDTGQYLFYGLTSIDASLVLRISAWLRIDLKFTKIHIDISFSFSIQLSIALELALAESGIGAHADVRVAISVFGATLSVGVGFTIGSGLDAARARVQRFMAMSLTADAPEPTRLDAAKNNNNAIEANAGHAKDAATPPAVPQLPEKPDDGAVVGYAALGVPIPKTDFWLVLRRMRRRPEGITTGGFVYGMLIPSDGHFFAGGNADTVSHKLTWTDLTTKAFKLAPETRKFVEFDLPDSVDIAANVNSKLAQNEDVTLRTMLNACFLIDAEVSGGVGKVKKYAEPKDAPSFATARRLDATDEREQANERARHQSAFAAAVKGEGEVVTAVRDARTTLLGHFIEQFNALAESGIAPKNDIHVADFGLVFALKPEDAEDFAKKLTVKKSDSANPGKVTLLNRPALWFENSDPVLKGHRSTVDVDGIKLDWNLDPIFDAPIDDPEHFLHHYEIVRVAEKLENVRRTFTIKPVATPGGLTEDKKVELLKPNWQFTDDLSDLPDNFRKALLPKGGPDDAPARVAEWLAAFQDDDDIAVTYTVTPVDVAGTRGLPRSMIVHVKRPDVPVRPATAQLYVIVPRPPLEAARPLNDTSTPPDLKVFLALSDPHWDGEGAANWLLRGEKASDKNIVRRGYRLILDPEDVVPSGAFGGDALTERRRTPGVSDDLLPTADEVTFPIKRDPDSPKPPFVFDQGATPPELNVTDDEKKDFALWVNLSKLVGSDLHDALWKRAQTNRVAVAVRAYLETVMTVQARNSAKPLALVSRRVPVDIEIRVPAVDDTKKPLVMRPAAFEWPVRIDYPPLTAGGVRAFSGLASFRGPDNSEITKDDPKFAYYLDPGRRTLTEVFWAAAPDAGPTQLVAGYDLFELDLDELAPSDTSGGDLDKSEAWNRARRIARTHLLRRSEAMLSPGVIDDPTAWQSSMPSEVWRCDRSGDKSTRRGTLPIRKGWYSPRESCLAWPENVPRRTLLDHVNDDLVASLMKNGPPMKLDAVLNGGAIPVKLGDQKICDVGDEPVLLQDGLTMTGNTITAVNGKFTAQLIRQALMCLEPAETGTSLDGAVLEITSRLTVEQTTVTIDNGVSKATTTPVELTVTRTIPIAPDGDLHPLLAETLNLLAWTRENDGTLYRRYEVVVEPVAPIKAKDAISLLTATGPEKDPYGWMTLVVLGLAASIRLHDGDTGEFVLAETLIKRAKRVFGAVLARYIKAGGAPMLDLFVRPGEDRAASDIDDAKLDPTGIPDNDDALAFVQLSLRPRPLQSFQYSLVTIDAGDDITVHVKDPGTLIGDIVIYRIADGSVVTLTRDLPEQKLLKLPASAEPVVRLLIRHPRGFDVATLFDTGAHASVATFDNPEDADQSSETVYENGAFGEIDAAVFTALAAVSQSDERKSLASLAQRMARVPNVVVPADFLDTPALLGFFTPYVNWMRRFLEHTLLSKQDSGFSLCAPVQQQPWKLAPHVDGTVSLKFLHDDRFAHARAYAVHPVGRYHEQAVAVQKNPESARPVMEGLILPNTQTTIGNAVAVAPRTARLETPTIISSRKLPLAGEPWQLVVARHPEQDLILSSRSLFARLAFEGTALTWVQDYPDRVWPAGLEASVGVTPDYALVRKTKRPDPGDIAGAPQLIDDDLVDAAAADPKIWKGAEIYRLPRLPHHLRVTALAAARAGAVVSEISYVTQRDFHFELPHDLARRRRPTNDAPSEETIPEPQWTLEAINNKTYLCFHISALSYADLMPKETFALWVANGADVALWPDPGVVYSLIRESKSSSGNVFEVEAEIFSTVPDSADVKRPLALRARGPSWRPPDFDVKIDKVSNSDAPLFALTACLEPVAVSRRIAFTDPSDPNTWIAFRNAAGAFVKLEAAATGGVMTLIALPPDILLTTLGALGDDPSKKLTAILKQLVLQAVLDGASRWLLRAEKGTAQAESRTITPRNWS